MHPFKSGSDLFSTDEMDSVILLLKVSVLSIYEGEVVDAEVETDCADIGVSGGCGCHYEEMGGGSPLKKSTGYSLKSSSDATSGVGGTIE